MVKKIGVFTVLIVLLTLLLSAVPVSGAGASTATINATHSKGFTIYGATATNYVVAINVDSADGILGDSNLPKVGYACQTTSGSIIPLAFMLEFDLTSVAGYEISSAKVRLNCTNRSDTSSLYSNFYFAIYNTDGGLDNAIGVADWDTMLDIYGGERLSNVYQYTDCNVGDFDLTLMADGLDNVRTGNKIFFMVAMTNHATQSAPAWESAKGMYLEFNSKTSGNPPQLILTYAAPAGERTVTIPANDAVDGSVDGTEETDSINLVTPRYLFADEDMAFDVVGDSGARLNLVLQDTTGATVQSNVHTDSVRVNGHYYWTVGSLASNTDVICRAVDTVSGMFSDWVSVKPSPNGNMQELSVYCESTVHPPFRNEMSYYRTFTDDVMTVYWKTNIDGSTELGDYSLALYPQGDNSTALYDKVFTDLIADMGGTSTNQEAMAHWRYMLFYPSVSSGSDYGGLIHNLNVGYSNAYKGLICPVVHATDGSWLTTTQSAYWYLSDSGQAMTVTPSKTVYKKNERIYVNLSVGADCNIEMRLNALNVRYLNSSAVAVTNYQDYSFTEGKSQVALSGISSSGSYIIELQFTGSATEFEYYRWVDISVNDQTYTGGTSGSSSGGGGFGEDIGTLIKNWVSGAGMDDEAGHWIILIAVMAISALIFSFNRVMQIVAPLAVLAIGMVIQWVNPAIVVLLALGAGLSLWALFRKKAISGGDS